MASGRGWAVLMLVALLATTARAQFAVELELAGLEVGVASERQAIRRLGKGFRVDPPGGGTVRIFADPSGMAALYVTSTADGVVEEIQVTQRLGRPYHPQMRCQVAPAAWRTHARIGLGATRRRVLATYGDPTQETDVAGLHWMSYKTDFARDRRVRLYYQASFGFHGDRLTRILIHNGN